MEDSYNLTFSPHITSGKSPTKRPLYRNQDPDTTTYHDYPTKPFINDDYKWNPTKPVKAFPENNRTAVISALKNLQEKIRKLEVERGAAENNLKSLAAETTRYKDILQRDRDVSAPVQSTVSIHTQAPRVGPDYIELESQLSAAETRSQLLEKQLDYMRKMVQTSDREREVQDIVMKPVTPEKPPTIYPQPGPPPEYLKQKEKLTELEREHLRLTATQTLAEGKIRDLEEKLQEERHHRKLMQEKATELESVARTQRLLIDGDTDKRKVSSKTKKATKKKKKTANNNNKKQKPSEPIDYMKHYRLNLADIPFVAGKSSSASHSVGANVQKVLSLMKNHNMALCASHESDGQSESPSSGSSSSTSINNDLAELLLQLQDEFGQMSCEHQELSKEINEATDSRVKEDLERELDALVTRMEGKSQQISKIRKHQQKLDDKKKPISKKTGTKRERSADSNRRPVSSGAYYTRNGEVEVTTTIKTRGERAGLVHVRPVSARDVSLNVLKDMKKLQTTLRKDDLSWE